MHKLVGIAVTSAVMQLLPQVATAGMPSGGDPLTPMELPTNREVAFDMLVVRQNPNLPQATVDLGNADFYSLKATVNGANDTINITKNGVTTTITFSQAAMRAYPTDAVSRTSFMNDLDSFATDRENRLSYEMYSNRSGVTFQDGGVVEPACALVPCQRRFLPPEPQTDYWQSFIDFDWNTVPPAPWWQGQFSNEIIEYDILQFQQAKEEACARDQDPSDTLGAGGAATAACFGSTLEPWLLAGCGAGIGELVSRLRDHDFDHRMCYKQQYPGPGRWRRTR